jgi:hypothetical protein
VSGTEHDRGRGHEHEATPRAAREVLAVLAAFRIRRMASWGGPSRSSFVPLRDGEHQERDAAAEKCAGDDVREGAAARRLPRL